MNPRAAHFVGLAIFTSFAHPNVAGAVDKSECVAAYEQAQILRDASRLRGAREQLLLCTQPSCPTFIKTDCTHWLKDVEINTPTVVISARDQNGREITAVRVTADGVPFLESLDGKAAALDPGPHVLRFERGGDTPAEQKYVIHQGERNRAITVQLGHVERPSNEPVVEAGASGNTAWGWVVGALGVGGIGSFAYFGLSGRADLDRLRSQCAPSCRQTDVDAARRKLLVADASLGIGVVSLGVATWLILSRDAKHRPAAEVGFRPLLDGGVTELAVTF